MLLFLKLNKNSPHGELPQLQLAPWQASLVNADVMRQQGECVHSRQHVKTTAAVHVLRKTYGWVSWHGPSLRGGGTVDSTHQGSLDATKHRWGSDLVRTLGRLGRYRSTFIIGVVGVVVFDVVSIHWIQ